MEIMGVLTYTTDGSYYYVWWHPNSETHEGEHAVVLGSLAVKMLKGPEDFKAWQDEVQKRYEVICQGLFGSDFKLEMEVVHASSTAN